MPPTLVVLALVAVAVPAAARAALGRPRLLLPAMLASAAAAALAQAGADLVRLGLGVVGDTQLGAAVAACVFATAVVALAERPYDSAKPRS